jgi:sec-independent protein translocase protein TatB
MFEIGFLELVLLGVIALLVVGPSRLPGLVRTVGVWVGRAQRLVSQVRADIEREVRADELRKAAKEYSPTAVISDMKKEVEDLANEVSKPVDLDAEKAEAEKAEAEKAEAEKSEKAEAAQSVPEKPEAGKSEAGVPEAKVPEAGKSESSDGGATARTEPADAVATEPEADAVAPEEADGAGAEDPEPTERPAGDVSAPETAANAQPEASEPAPDSEPADGGTDRAAAPAVTERADTPPAEADERSAAA